jgi:hypothetical protein
MGGSGSGDAAKTWLARLIGMLGNREGTDRQPLQQQQQQQQQLGAGKGFGSIEQPPAAADTGHHKHTAVAVQQSSIHTFSLFGCSTRPLAAADAANWRRFAHCFLILTHVITTKAHLPYTLLIRVVPAVGPLCYGPFPLTALFPSWWLLAGDVHGGASRRAA